MHILRRAAHLSGDRRSRLRLSELVLTRSPKASASRCRVASRCVLRTRTSAIRKRPICHKVISAVICSHGCLRMQASTKVACSFLPRNCSAAGCVTHSSRRLALYISVHFYSQPSVRSTFVPGVEKHSSKDVAARTNARAEGRHAFDGATNENSASVYVRSARERQLTEGCPVSALASSRLVSTSLLVCGVCRRYTWATKIRSTASTL